MGRFYGNRGAEPKASKSEALRQAQIAMIKGEMVGLPDDERSGPTSVTRQDVTAPAYPKDLPEWSHPYFWATFVLLGNTR